MSPLSYGENVDEVNANPDWLCPLCRDICNCSFHRSKRGWAPTGTLYRHAIAEGEPQAWQGASSRCSPCLELRSKQRGHLPCSNMWYALLLRCMAWRL